jgi:uncharacterized protein (DUF488 family)
MTPLYTTGYQGQTIDSFVAGLRDAGIELVIDVRKVPRSRKPGFSKNVLASNLAAVSIGYVHIDALGTPGELRNEVRRTKDYDVFFDAYRAHLRTEEDVLVETLPLLTERRCCLLCFEQHPNECHRTVVAQELNRVAGNTLDIRHLI